MLTKYPNCSLHILPTIEQKFMHNKFCVIDNTWVLTGSYNWSDKAESNYENILILENKNIAEDFIAYFEILKLKAPQVTDFKAYKKGFISTAALDSTEIQTNQLAKEFENKVLQNLELSKKYIKINFNNVKDIIHLYSGTGAARILCNNSEIQIGLQQLRDAGQLNLSFERMVLQPEFATLFSDKTKATARKKLIACKYVFDDI
jgi:hypothetical protein